MEDYDQCQEECSHTLYDKTHSTTMSTLIFLEMRFNGQKKSNIGDLAGVVTYTIRLDEKHPKDAGYLVCF
jgi:hypothetical protein